MVGQRRRRLLRGAPAALFAFLAQAVDQDRQPLRGAANGGDDCGDCIELRCIWEVHRTDSCLKAKEPVPGDGQSAVICGACQPLFDGFVWRVWTIRNETRTAALPRLFGARATGDELDLLDI